MTKDIIAGALLGLLTGTAVVPAQEGAALEVALIDGTTGDVLWVNRGRNAGPGALGHGAATMVENILTRLPGDEKVFTVQRDDSSGETAPATHSGFQQE